VEKTWKPITAGILSIITGVNGIYLGVLFIIGFFFIFETIQEPGFGILLIVAGTVAIARGLVIFVLTPSLS